MQFIVYTHYHIFIINCYNFFFQILCKLEFFISVIKINNINNHNNNNNHLFSNKNSGFCLWVIVKNIRVFCVKFFFLYAIYCLYSLSYIYN